ncbi:hypothetical protein BGZ80_004124 [Entomortierella chlamydospora]|uniref:Uncharacterized protein n=1 Tax=Entomortierella chlamydospora TaxID=101097 RepID=A0A9P6SW94_9FUNG|nr:hypothetical protein BGZ80_004124 [Entomortierella chlamydospora]
MAQGQASSQSFTVEELDITWIRSAVDRSPNAFFNAFSLCNKMLALQRYTWMVKNSDLDEDTEKTLLSRFETWKVDHATDFWAKRRIQS